MPSDQEVDEVDIEEVSAPVAVVQGALYVVATPIGNLEDVTLRALRVLRECDLIASEDTRTTRKLLARHDLHTPLSSYHQHSGGQKAARLVEIIKSGKSVALVSEAGTPAISDPGHELVRGCVDAGLPVIPVPGPNAAIALLSASGLDTSSFTFRGFPPRKAGERLRFVEALVSERRTSVFYESPNRLRQTLETMAEFLEERRICLGRELSKVHEEIWRGTVREALEEFSERRPRGEFVVALEGAKVASGEAMDLEQEYRAMKAQGMDNKSILTALAAVSGRPRREIYAAILIWRKKP